MLRARWLIGFAAIFAFMLAGLLLMEFTNRYNGGIWLRDFQVFHRAGGRVLSGEELFRPVRDGYYSYKYSPTAAILFIPFSLIPFEAAEVVYWLFVSGLVLVGLYLSLMLIYPEFRSADPARLGFLLAITVMTLGVHIWSELTLGQVNYLLLVMYIAIAWLFTQSKPALLAFIWALSIFIKPFGLILLPYFVFKKRYREIGYFFGFSALLFISPAVFYGGHFLDLQRSWISAMTLELGNKADLLQPGNHTLVAVLAQYSHVGIFEPGSVYLIVYKTMVLLLVGLLAFLVVRRGSGIQHAEALDFAFILALAPLLSYTSNNAFVLAELGIILLLFNFGKLKAWEKVMAACGCLLIGGNFYNQLPYEWGERFFAFYDSISLLTIGTILLLITIFMLRWRETL
ncbi:MAG: glycosyltransferase family 87 protein [Thermoleophilia bacterium]|nr:glycosyltransferase family 87 protein [Thermoleophilia bacterium]